jgi:hypothetical protein
MCKHGAASACHEHAILWETGNNRGLSFHTRVTQHETVTILELVASEAINDTDLTRDAELLLSSGWSYQLHDAHLSPEMSSIQAMRCI